MSKTTPIYNNWKFDRILGSGGFGIVQLWTHSNTGQKLAIKKCKWAESQLTQTQKDRWIHEVEIMKHLHHPNIVKIENMPFQLPDEILPVLCMEYCVIGNFRKVLNEPENCCGISEKDTFSLFSDISSAVEYLHQLNITHRDLKPENIVLQCVNNKIIYKLIDLGYAKEIGEASTCASIVGTLHYVAPELLYNKKYSCTVDYWSLGILFYEVVTGIRPFLPRMQHTMTWMQHIRQKDYNHICAYESNDNVIFGTNIESPTHLSRCIKEKLVAWFRVVLQWDPKKRGRQILEDGTSKVVVFSMLSSILSKKVLYVFSITLYKIYSYEVDETTNVEDVRKMIEKETDIAVDHQLLTNYYGKIIDDNNSKILSQINDDFNNQNPILFVFQTQRLLMKEVATPDIPPYVSKMMEQSGCLLDPGTLQDYYRVTIFFMKTEIHLFQLYFFALSIKIDLLNDKINTFNKNMEQALLEVNELVKELINNRTGYTEKSTDPKIKETLKDVSDKINKLYVAAERMECKLRTLINKHNTLRNNIKQDDCMMDLSQPYNEALKILDSMKDFYRKQKPNKMVKEIFDFLSIREKVLHGENINNIASETISIENELETLERSFNSVIAMTTEYKKELSNIKECDVDMTPVQQSSKAKCPLPAPAPPPPPPPPVSLTSTDTIPSDNIIYDNIVMRHTLESLLAHMKEKYTEMLHFD